MNITYTDNELLMDNTIVQFVDVYPVTIIKSFTINHNGNFLVTVSPTPCPPKKNMTLRMGINIGISPPHDQVKTGQRLSFEVSTIRGYPDIILVDNRC